MPLSAAGSVGMPGLSGYSAAPGSGKPIGFGNGISPDVTILRPIALNSRIISSTSSLASQR